MTYQTNLFRDEPNRSPTQLLPLAAMMLAGSLTVGAQEKGQVSESEKTLQIVIVKDALESPTLAKDNFLVKKSFSF